MVDYNSFAKTFSRSRQNMKWEEIEYFLNSVSLSCHNWERNIPVLDVGCGNGRLLEALLASPLASLFKWEGNKNYLWIDLSEGLLEEARRLHPRYQFQEMNMLHIASISSQFAGIFFIASFHHLQTFEERRAVLAATYRLLQPGWQIYMTNWALDSSFHLEKYRSCRIEKSKNEFWSLDYMVPFSGHDRFYHCFSLDEIEKLAETTGFTVLENRLFDTEKNYITILKKPLS